MFISQRMETDYIIILMQQKIMLGIWPTQQSQM